MLSKKDFFSATILIIDDNILSVTLIEEILELAGTFVERHYLTAFYINN